MSIFVTVILQFSIPINFSIVKSLKIAVLRVYKETMWGGAVANLSGDENEFKQTVTFF